MRAAAAQRPTIVGSTRENVTLLVETSGNQYPFVIPGPEGHFAAVLAPGTGLCARADTERLFATMGTRMTETP